MPSAFIFFRILKSRRSRFRAGQRLDLNLFSTHLPCFPKKEKEKKTQPKKGIAKEGRHRREKIRERSVRAKFYFLSNSQKSSFLSSEEDPKTHTTFEFPFNLICHSEIGVFFFFPPGKQFVLFPIFISRIPNRKARIFMSPFSSKEKKRKMRQNVPSCPSEISFASLTTTEDLPPKNCLFTFPPPLLPSFFPLFHLLLRGIFCRLASTEAFPSFSPGGKYSRQKRNNLILPENESLGVSSRLFFFLSGRARHFFRKRNPGVFI